MAELRRIYLALGLEALEGQLLPIIIAVTLIVISTLAFVCVCLRRGNKGNNVCLVGLSDAGKTLLFLRLTSGFYSRTQNSMKENIKTYTPTCQKGKKGKPLEVVDIPGNERLRARVLQRYQGNMRALVWVIDSVNFPKEIRSLAHLGHALFSNPFIQKRKTPVLVACNKQDLALAESAEDVQLQLEKEISQVMVSKAAQLASLDSSSDQKAATIPGCSEGAFSFSSLLCNQVEFVSCSARGKGDEEDCVPSISDVQNWIDRHC